MGLFSGKCASTARLDGKIVIITGANTGIGKETALDLFKRGACVIMACKNLERANIAAAEIQQSCQDDDNVGKLEIAELDLSRLNSVTKCVKVLQHQPRIDILINNAGVMCCPYEKTEDDYEMQLQTNYLGHFLLTMLLLPKIIKSRPARIINVSSVAHTSGRIDFNDLNWEKKPYKSLSAYQQSKLCNILFTKELSRRMEGNIAGVTTYSLHPGIISTQLGRHLNKTYFPGTRWLWRTFVGYFLKTPIQGAQTTIHCAVDEHAGKETGLYYSNCKVKEPSSRANNIDDAKKLWDVSIQLAKLEHYDPFKNQ